MVKIFATGDLHIGKSLSRFPKSQSELLNSRFECLSRMVKEAEKQGCSIFAITGDTFDTISSVKVADVRRVVEILATFSGTVLMLPGNHDYYTDEIKVWKDFRNAMNSCDHNIRILNEFKPVDIEVGNEIIRIYPAFCQSKYQPYNNLDWIKNSEIDRSIYNVGIAHGAIQGLTPDTDGQYFLMTEQELNAIPVDAWLIGHTHILYPRNLEENIEYHGYKIYNAGTPEQLDLHNNTQGYAFIITLDREKNENTVTAELFHSGSVEYRNVSLTLTPEADALRNKLIEAVADTTDRTITRFILNGTVTQEEYDNRKMIYEECLSGLMDHEELDDNLNPQITKERIYEEFPQFGFAASVLEQLMDDPMELQLAYNLLKECKEE